MSDFYNRLRNIFSEAEMETATPGTTLICKLIASLPPDGNKERIKGQLLEQFRKIPIPKEEELTKFTTVIKEHESLVTAKDYKIQTGRTVGRIQEDPKTEPNPHYLCGRGKCTQKCSGCDKIRSHLEADCWVLHPAKKPKDFGTPKKGS